MRLREAVAVALLVAFATGACSRLTFIKPKLKRSDSDVEAPSYDFKDSSATKKRLAAQDLAALAAAALQQGQVDDARKQAMAALKTDPDSVDANTVLAVVEQQAGNSAAAGGYYAKAAALAPNDGAMLNNYGTWLCNNGRAGESLAYFDRALRSPGYDTPAAALANAGACSLQAGQYARAETTLKQALAMDPNSLVALAAMAETEYDRGNYLDARAFSERRLAAGRPTAHALLVASQIEQRLGDGDAAAKYLRRLRSEFPQASNAQQGDGGRR